MRSKETILALDIGSSSVRASLFDHAGEPVPKTFVKQTREFRRTRDGGSTLDANAAFREVVSVIDEVVAKAKRFEITNVAMCTFWHSLLGINADGRPTTTVFGWADTRSKKYSAVLKAHFNETTVHNRTGAHFHSSYWPAKLLWIREEMPEVFERTVKWISFGDYVLNRLADPAYVPMRTSCWSSEGIRFIGLKPTYEEQKLPHFTSISMASGTGLFELRRYEWDVKLLTYLGLERSHLPAVLRNNADRFALNYKYRRRWRALDEAWLVPAIGDGAADHIGSCGIGKTKASLMVGTSAAMRVAYEGEPPKSVPKGLWCYRVDRDRVIVGGALSDGGNLYQKFKRELKVPSRAEDKMRQRGAAAHGLTVLPFFFGERSTGYREDARGAFLGDNPDVDAVDLLQAAMEAVAYRLAEIHDRLRKVARSKTIVISGGALRDSPVWKQIIADVLGRDLAVADSQESALRGTVLLALESLGKIENIDRFPSPDISILEHHPRCHKEYRAARKRHQAAYKKQ